MTFKSISFTTLATLLAFVSLPLIAQDKAQGGDVVHAVAGVVSKVDSASKTIAMKTADGSEEAFKYTEKTTVHASKKVAHGASTASADAYMAGKEGTHVVVHYTGEGADQTAIAVDDFGKDGLKFGQGTVTHVDRAAHTVTIKTEDGSEQTYHVAKDAAVDTEHGVEKGIAATKEGEHVAVHYTDEAGKKVVHLIRHI